MKGKVWTGRYWMSEKHAKNISNKLKEYYKSHDVWNKGTLKPKEYYLEQSRKRRSDENYYIKELENNAKRRYEKGYDRDEERLEQIRQRSMEYKKITGAGRPRKDWSDIETKYLIDNFETTSYLEICKELDRSWCSISRKLSRLGLRKYHKWKK